MNLSSTTLSTSTPNRSSAAISTKTSDETVNSTSSSTNIHQNQNQHGHQHHDSITMTNSGTPPTPGFKVPVYDKKNKGTSLKVLLPKLPSTDSLSGNSIGPSSPAHSAGSSPQPRNKSFLKYPSFPSNDWLRTRHILSNTFKGIANWTDSSQNVPFEKHLPTDASKLNRKESYKAQRKNYRREKKRVASELLNSLQDPTIIVLADWLKVRGTLKSWTKLWCVLKPGLLLLYKSPKTKSSHWVGTVLLTSCQIIERPSKKDGFCFKLFHPLDQSIWAPRGPDKETMGAVVQPLPTAYLIFRAPSQAAGKCWMDALELSLRCSALLLRSASGSGNHAELVTTATAAETETMTHETQWSEADYEKHFHDHENLTNIKNLPEKPPLFLAKYIPPTPPSESRNAFHSNSSISTLASSHYRSQCPSPTPLFQQLYLAVAHWERVLADSPELSVERSRIIEDLEGIPMMGKVLPIRDCGGGGDDDSDDEVDTVDDDEASNETSSPMRSRLNVFDSSRQSSTSIISHDDDLVIDNVITPTATVDNFQSLATDVQPSHNHRKNKKITNNTSSGNKDHLDIDSQTDGANAVMSGLDSESESDVAEGGHGADGSVDAEDDVPETSYVHSSEEEFGEAGEQVEELADEHKSLIWFVVKQVRPGMDLSKVVLPTFILEPRSFLDKLSDSYYHADYLSQAVLEDDPFNRMKLVVKWYLSGFYKKPKGLKKPYNPILGETFRCYWQHENGSRTFYIAEQVSHHPPISAFYVTNRQDGFSINCSMLAKSKFYGNSTSAILEGTATLTLLPRGESYTLTIPYAHCKGILMGTLSMELGGKVNVECEYTGYKTEMEFKLKPFLGGSENTNLLTARVKLGKETLATIRGYWDGEIKIKDSRSGDESMLFAPTSDVRGKRLKRFTVPIESQGANESERLWQHVSAAIGRDDQEAATEEKTALEESQRALAKERHATCTEWNPVLFQQDIATGQWHYKCADLRPWDPRNDLRQYESNYEILTKTCHVAPMVRTASIINSEPIILQADSRSSLTMRKKNKRLLGRKISTPDLVDGGSDSSHSGGGGCIGGIRGTNAKMLDSMQNINKRLEEQSKTLAAIKLNLDKLNYLPNRDNNSNNSNIQYQSIIYIAIGLIIQTIITWFFIRK